MTRFTGGCLCGAIRYEVNGDPVRIVNGHCDDCWRATGSSFGTYVFVNEGDLAILHGTPKTFEHANDIGATMTKQFCKNCGTQLFGKGSRGEGMVHVKVGTIDDASFYVPVWTRLLQRSSERTAFQRRTCSIGATWRNIG